MAHAHPLLRQPLHLLLQLAQNVQIRLVLLGVLLQLNYALVRGLLGEQCLTLRTAPRGSGTRAA